MRKITVHDWTGIEEIIAKKMKHRNYFCTIIEGKIVCFATEWFKISGVIADGIFPTSFGIYTKEKFLEEYLPTTKPYLKDFLTTLYETIIENDVAYIWY
jgi:hypothetical protein